MTPLHGKKVNYHKTPQLGDTTSSWWVGEQGSFLVGSATWDGLLRAHRCRSQMRGNGTPGGGTSMDKGKEAGKYNRNIEAQRGGCEVRQWGLVVCGAVTCTATWGFPRRRGGHGKLGDTAAIRLTPPCECRGQEGPGPQQGKGKGWSLVLTGSPESSLRSQTHAFLVLSSTLKRM